MEEAGRAQTGLQERADEPDGKGFRPRTHTETVQAAWESEDVLAEILTALGWRPGPFYRGVGEKAGGVVWPATVTRVTIWALSMSPHPPPSLRSWPDPLPPVRHPPTLPSPSQGPLSTGAPSIFPTVLRSTWPQSRLRVTPRDQTSLASTAPSLGPGLQPHGSRLFSSSPHPPHWPLRSHAQGSPPTLPSLPQSGPMHSYRGAPIEP